MNTAAIRNFRGKLAAGQPTFGLWVTLEAPSITEMAVALGMDWVVIDAEHGHLDWKEIVEHLRAAVRSDTVALVRIAELNGGVIKRALDIGADGIVIPWVESAEQVAQAVRYCRYPLEGARGIGGERATAWGQCLVEHTAAANEHVLVLPMIETVRTVPHVPAMCQVEGVDCFFFGPADYSSSAGYRGQWEGPGVAEQILAMKDIIRQAGKHCGIMATSAENARERVEQGFNLVSLGADAGLLLRSLHGALGAVGRDRAIRLDPLTPVKAAAPAPMPDATPQAASAPDATPQAAERKTPFRVALTGDFYDSTGKLRYRDIGLDLLKGVPGVEMQRFAADHLEVGPDQLAGVHGVIVLSPRVTAASVSRAGDLLAIGRFGVGYDSVDVAACTAADVALFIAAGAVDRSVAEATLAWMLALTHHVRQKDQIVRDGRWDERSRFMGSELRDRTLGIIGFGGIGRALARLVAGLGMNAPLIFDPFVAPAAAVEFGAQVVSLDDLLARADFVSIHCPLNDKTRNLIGARELALMKPGVFLFNTARGGIVDEDALHAALSEKRIAGAGIDCFVGEPLTAAPKLAKLDNVLLAPHAIAWTDELFRDMGRAVCRGMLDLAQGKKPRGVINPEVFDRPGFQAKWKGLCP